MVQATGSRAPLFRNGFSIEIRVFGIAQHPQKNLDHGGVKQDTGVSQVFIAINPTAYAGENYADTYIENMSEYIKTSAKAVGINDILYPGERAARERRENLREGIPVNQGIWETVLKL